MMVCSVLRSIYLVHGIKPDMTKEWAIDECTGKLVVQPTKNCKKKYESKDLRR